MKNEMQIFLNEQFGQVRTTLIDGAPWFVAADVCKALEIGNPTMALVRLDDDEKNTLNSTEGIHKKGRGNPLMNIINEPGLYTLVLSSRKPEAKQFKRWITHEVIPAIRKYGGYLTDELLTQIEENEKTISRFVNALINEREKSGRLEQRLSLTQPKADYFDAFVNPYECTNIRTTAKELAIPERHFCKYLQHARLLYRAPAGNLMPYAKPFREGLFIVRDFHYWHSPEVGHYTLFTPKGKNELLLRRDEILAEPLYVWTARCL